MVSGGGSLRAVTYVVQLVAVGVGYFLLETFTLQLAAAHPNAAAIWPPAGFAFAAVMLAGYRILPAVFAGAFLAHVLPSGPSYAAGAIAAGNTLEAFALGSLVDGWADGRTTFAATGGIARFVPIAMIAAAIGASVGAGTDLLLATPPSAQPAGWGTFVAEWLPWWLRDVTAGLVITPALVLWVTDRPRALDLASLGEGSAIVAAAAAVGAIVFGPLMSDVPDRAALAFLAVLPLIWAALRRGLRDTATVALVLAGCAVWGTMAGGPFAQGPEQPSPLLVMFLIGGTVPSLLLAADAVARGRAERMLRTTRNELRQAREQLAQSHKMEAVGQLTGGVAHDFNNLLTVIVGNLDMAQRQLETWTDAQAERLRRAINNARRGAARATAITQRLLAFSRKQRVEPRPINVNNLLSNLSDFLRRSVGETVALDIVPADDLWTVETDPMQLETAILNLAVNARDAMPAGGKVTITTGNSFLDEEYCREHEELVAGQYVQIAVNDSGIGMAKDVLERVFEPFFTTKEAGQGTGLGLAQVYGFVKQSGGHVEIDSEPGKGTTVRLFLPRLAGKAAVEQTPERPAFLLDTGPTILLVEDDHDVRAYVVEILREMHFQVLEAHDADSALGLLERNDLRLDLLLTDVVLPGMNGRQLAEEMKRRQPEIRVLFMSGYSHDAIVQHGQVEPGVEVMQKPLTREILAQRIREVLEDA
jgi:signal transduction histidine kinase/CheY-like chemotaxis protein